jgi:hypothetical protein
MPIGSYLVKKFLAFYETWRFIIALTSACHLSVSWARSIKSVPSHPTFWRSILILFSYLAWVFLVLSFLQVFPPKPSINPPLLHRCYIPHLPHSYRFDHPKNIGWGLHIIKFLITNFFHSPVLLSLLGTNMFLSTLFCNTLSLRTSLNVSDKFHTHTKQVQITYT